MELCQKTVANALNNAPIGKYYVLIDLEQSRLIGAQVLNYGAAYEPGYPDYFRLDGRVPFKLNRKKFNTELAFDVQNLTRVC